MDSPVIETLADLHEAPWSEIAGARLRVRVGTEVLDARRRGKRQAARDTGDEPTVREGVLTGRHVGRMMMYVPGDGVFADAADPMVVMQTPAGTMLQIHTDREGNELLAFEPDGADAADAMEAGTNAE